MWLTRRGTGVAVAILALSLAAQAEMDERSFFDPPAPTPTPTPSPTPLPPAATSTPPPQGDITDFYSDIIRRVVVKLGYENPNVRVLDYDTSPEAQAIFTIDELQGVDGFYGRRGNFIALVTEQAADTTSPVLWHELAHALLPRPVRCWKLDYRSSEFDLCVHDGNLRYLAKELWETAKIVQGYDKDWWTFDGCSDAELKLYDDWRKQGVNGSGKGFPIAWVSNAVDVDGDGVVCEVGGS